MIEFDAHWFGGIERSCNGNQHLREIGVDGPVVRVVGIGQGGTPDAAAKPRVIEFRAHGTETGLDVAQTLAIGQLREDHRQIPIPTGETARVRVATRSANAFFEIPCEVAAP